MSLEEYNRKRDFKLTKEPSGKGKTSPSKVPRFVIQKHDATRLHYDFRIELGGTLVSWAVPKGLPLIKGEKHLAVKVEDHPLSYFDFEGTIPKGQYGGGTVQVWDVGTYEPLTKNVKEELKNGKLHFVLHGKKLQGEWYLVRLRDEEQWLVIRAGEDHPKLAKTKEAKSVLSGKTLVQLSKAGDEKPKTVKAKKIKEDVIPEIPLAEVTFIEPMKARLADAPPAGDWIYEIKFDGFRAVAYKDGKSVRLLSRTNHDLTLKFPEVAEAIQKIKTSKVIIDGEIVALDSEGRSSFQLLQAYELGQERPPICFYAFDLLAVASKSYVDLSVEKRKEKLKTILPSDTEVIRYSASLGSDAEALLKMAGKHGLEGIIGKEKNSLYEVGRRSGSWIKLKLIKQQEFVIGGYTDPEGSRSLIGAILVGVYEKNKLVYCGKVGTGFTQAILKDLHTRFAKISETNCPFSDLPEERTGRYGQGITASVMKKCHWIKPQLVCQVKFSEWTNEGRLRQPVYLGLREDKPAKKVIREIPA